MALKASDTKHAQVRKEVWNRLYDEDLLENPTLPYRIVPIFKGIDAAVEMLLGHEVVKNTDKVLLSMEKSLRTLRFRILQAKGVMYATTYRSNLSTVCRVDAPESANKFVLKQCANLIYKGRIHSIAEGEVKFDVLVVSSVAVSKTGKRISKDDLLGELEFCILTQLGYVTPETIIVTLVHDVQVFDDLPSDVQHHSIPADYIVTPTQVIKCPKGQKTTSIAWSTLNADQMESVAVIKNIRYKQWKEGKDVRLSGETEITEDLQPASPVDPKRSPRKGEKRRTLSSSEGKKRDSESKAGQEGGKTGGESGRTLSGGLRRGPRRYFRRQRRRVYSGRQSEGDFKPAIYVGELPKSLTSEQLTDLLARNDVKPVNVVRHDTLTHAFAIFDSLDEVNTCLARLEGLTLDDKPLKIELSRRTARRKNKDDIEGDQSAPGHNGASLAVKA